MSTTTTTYLFTKTALADDFKTQMIPDLAANWDSLDDFLDGTTEWLGRPDFLTGASGGFLVGGDVGMKRQAADNLSMYSGDVFMIPGAAGDFGVPVDGMIWYNTTTPEFRFRENGAWVSLSSGGAPTTVDYLVGTADAGLSNEIVVGATPGGELGGTWATPTVDATHSGSAHHTKYTDAEAKTAAVLAGAITDTETRAPTHDAVFDVKTTADAAQTAAEVDADIATHAALGDAHHAELHTVASHSDTTATGAELETLTDGSETTLHSHAGAGGVDLLLIEAFLG